MPTLNYLPAWGVGYSYDVQGAVMRSDRGPSRQRRTSQKIVTIASVTRNLRYAELPYFEWFVRGICNDGQLAFTDSYADGAGLSTGLVRILNGAYNVSTDTRNHIITCELEIFG